MITVTFETPIDDLFLALDMDTRAVMADGLTRMAKTIPEKIQENILTLGTRGGNPAYPDVSRHQLSFRKNWPTSPDQQERYVEAHTPLIDTRELFLSFGETGSDLKAKDEIFIEIGSSTDYGWEHEFGQGTTPDGKPIYARPHLYLIEADEDEFEKLLLIAAQEEVA